MMPAFILLSLLIPNDPTPACHAWLDAYGPDASVHGCADDGGDAVLGAVVSKFSRADLDDLVLCVTSGDDVECEHASEALPDATCTPCLYGCSYGGGSLECNPKPSGLPWYWKRLRRMVNHGWGD